MRQFISFFSVGIACLLGMTAANAQQTEPTENYLFEAVKKDKALAKGFNELTEPLNKTFPWVASFGVATPAATEKVDDKEYVVYQGCKPHNCPSEAYVVVYNPADKKMVAGAFVKNNYQNNNLVESKVEWLGNSSLDFAAVIGKYLF